MAWIRRETENGTVQYICSNCYDYHEFRKDFGEHTFNENFIFCRRCGARNGTGVPPAITQPNELLTLEELQEMEDTTPVWWDQINSWVLVYKGNLTTWSGKHLYAKGCNGKFYRRPPEGGRKPDE